MKQIKAIKNPVARERNMEYKQKTKIYTIIIAALSLTFLLGLAFSSWGPWGGRSRENLITGIERGTVQQIQLGPENRFLRSDEAWLLQRSGDLIPTRRGAVDGLLEKIFSAQVLQNLGAGEEILKTSGLNQPRVLNLMDERGEEILRLEVGNRREDGRGSYARIDQGPVLWVDANLPGDFSKTINQWANLSIFDGRFELANVRQIEFRSPEGLFLEDILAQPFTLTKSEEPDPSTGQVLEQWNGAGALAGVDLELNTINSKLGNFIRLSGREVGFSSEQSFRNLKHSLIVDTTKGQFVLNFGDLEERGQPIQIENRRFWVGKFALKDILIYAE
jgi:hypothetical protein